MAWHWFLSDMFLICCCKPLLLNICFPFFHCWSLELCFCNSVDEHKSPRVTFVIFPSNKRPFPWIRLNSFICQGSFCHFSSNGGKLWRQRKKDTEALEAAVNKADSAQMPVLSVKAEPLVGSPFTEPGTEMEICDLWGFFCTYGVILNQSKNICLSWFISFDCKDGGQQVHPGSFYQMKPRDSIACLYPAVICVCPLTCAPWCYSFCFIRENSEFSSNCMDGGEAVNSCVIMADRLYVGCSFSRSPALSLEPIIFQQKGKKWRRYICAL